MQQHAVWRLVLGLVLTTMFGLVSNQALLVRVRVRVRVRSNYSNPNPNPNPNPTLLTTMLGLVSNQAVNNANARWFHMTPLQLSSSNCLQSLCLSLGMWAYKRYLLHVLAT